MSTAAGPSAGRAAWPVAPRRGRVPARRRRAILLPLVLIIIMLLAVLSSSFAFQVHAHQSAVQVANNKVQLRLAAEAGIHHALLLLRENRANPALWYDNEPLFHNQVVWSNLGDRAEIDISEELDTSSITYRYSLVADDPNNDFAGVRYGISDEASKLNINLATREQLTTLLQQVLQLGEGAEQEDGAPTVGALVDALIDWRDQDDNPGPEGAESDYYMTLQPAYTAKNNMFETVEELLLVRGFTARVLFGEDSDRNGLLTPNEDDGDDLFPPDNEDGLLNRGLLPFITVWSRDLNRSNDNINRVDLNGDLRQLSEGLADWLPEPVIQYIIAARNNGVTFRSPIELLDHSYVIGGNNNQNNNNNNRNNGNRNNGNRESGNPQGGNENEASPDDGGGRGGRNARRGANFNPQQGRGNDNEAGTPPGEDENEDPRQGDEEREPGEDDNPEHDGEGEEQGGEGTGDPEPPDGPREFSPVTLADLPILCDRTTTVRQPGLMGLININTAPREVLVCLVNDKFTIEHVDAILAARPGIAPELMATVAWPVTENVVPVEAMASIYPQITARSQQFEIQALGHADHLGMMVRLQAVVELRGHVPQYMYYRDVTELGLTFPVRGVREGDQRARDRRR